MEKKNCSLVECFDALVADGLSRCGVDVMALARRQERIGVAVSGGADSISLVTALSHLLDGKVSLFAVTVNHNIRPFAETGGDASYVESYCASIGVPCTRIDVPRGNIAAVAAERGMGVEEAARVVRYEAFEKFSKEFHLSFLCLAHTQNDQIETIVMRFLRGSGTGALSGIPQVRGIYVRPLLGVTRAEIESYLAEQHISFRTDKTNFDNAMMRNRIRNQIVPLLDRECDGWKSAVLVLARKAREDEEAVGVLVEQAVEAVDWQVDEGADGKSGAVVSMDGGMFARLLPAVQRRLLYRAVDTVGAQERIPYQFLEAVCRLSSKKAGEAECGGRSWTESASGIQVFVDNGRLFVQKKPKDATEIGFFVIIKEVGEYRAGPWSLLVEQSALGEITLTVHAVGTVEEKKLTLPALSFPFAFRSRQPGDETKVADGSSRTVAKIFDDWHVGSRRDLIPLVQELWRERQNVVCVWGSLLGYADWIVRNEV